MAALGEGYELQFSASNERAWLDRAQDACARAVNIDPRSSEAYTCLGKVNKSRGDYEQAIENFNHAIDLNDSNDEAYTALGSALEEKNRLDEAEKAYLRAIELRPQYWVSHKWLADFYNRTRRDYAKAIDYYYKAPAVSPGNGQIYSALGAASINDGRSDAAIPLLQKAIQLRPYAFPPYSNLGIAYFRSRRYGDAIGPFEQAVDLAKDYRVTGNLARAYWFS